MGQYVIKSHWPALTVCLNLQATAGKRLPSFKDFSAAPSRTPSGSWSWTTTRSSGIFTRISTVIQHGGSLPGHCVSNCKCHAFILLPVWLTLLHKCSNRFCLSAIKKKSALKERNTWSEVILTSRDINILSNLQINSRPAGFTLHPSGFPLRVEAVLHGQCHSCLCLTRFTLSVWWARPVCFLQPPQTASAAELLRPLGTRVSRGEIRLRPEPGRLQLHHRRRRVSSTVHKLRD